ncbi:MAG: ribonuclease activity regulator protein RraA [Gammaproteobacteria bacterium]|nr:ribonuclease activity regulator protein RraA [Gammaproteobacteria bacterium]|tara:strand:+ start:147 stop:626 length:480 start_codon:yes stop_codon:yes gene_type:complete
MKDFATADLSDDNDNIQICEGIFRPYGGCTKFMGMIRTVTAVEDNSYVKKLIEEKVDGDVMVIDGRGSMKCALLGDMLAEKACDNGWSGFIINGCVRDSEIINDIQIGVKALNTMPKKSEKKDLGKFKDDLIFAGVTFKEGEYVYSDLDGIIVSSKKLD